MKFDLSFTNPDEFTLKAVRLAVRDLRQRAEPMQFDRLTVAHAYYAKVTPEVAEVIRYGRLVGFASVKRYGKPPLTDSEIGACECVRFFLAEE